MKTYKILKLNLYDTRWLGEFKTKKEAEKQKVKYEKKGDGIYRIVEK